MLSSGGGAHFERALALAGGSLEHGDVETAGLHGGEVPDVVKLLGHVVLCALDLHRDVHVLGLGVDAIAQEGQDVVVEKHHFSSASPPRLLADRMRQFKNGTYGSLDHITG